MCKCKQSMQDVRMKLYADILLLNLSRGGTVSQGEDIAKKVISSFDKEFSITIQNPIVQP